MSHLAPGHRYKVALAKQSAEGTPSAAPDFIIPVYGGNLMPREDRQPHEVADGQPYRPGGYKSRGDVEGSPEFACFPNSLGRILMGHFGVDTVSGGADPYSHAFTRGDSPPWHTGWIARPKPDGTSMWEKFEDLVISSVEFAWAKGAPLRVTTGVVGKKAVGNVSAPVGGVENKLDNSEPWFTAIGSVLNLDLDATPAVSRIRNVEGFTLRFGYDDLELIQTDEFYPRYRDPGLWTVGFSADIVLENYEAYLATFYGSKTASAADHSQAIVSGALDFTIPVGPVADANRTLQFLLPALQYQLSAPDIDTSGRAVRANLTAELQRPASGEAATVKLKNAQAAAF